MMRHWMRHPRWRHFGRLLVSRRRPSALRRLQLSSTTDLFIIPKEDAASGARWRRQMNERVRRRNAWAVEERTLPTVPGRIPALRVCTSVGRKKEYKQLLQGHSWSNLIELDQIWRPNLAALPVRHACRDEDAAFWRTSAGRHRTSAATSEGEALDSCQRRYQ